jgi:hypothetical protein
MDESLAEGLDPAKARNERYENDYDNRNDVGYHRGQHVPPQHGGTRNRHGVEPLNF